MNSGKETDHMHNNLKGVCERKWKQLNLKETLLEVGKQVQSRSCIQVVSQPFRPLAALLYLLFEKAPHSLPQSLDCFLLTGRATKPPAHPCVWMCTHVCASAHAEKRGEYREGSAQHAFQNDTMGTTTETETALV